MIFRAKTACGDEDDSLSYLGLRSDFYVSKPVPTANDGSFAIHQQRVGWFGFGGDNFIEAIRSQQSRYAELNWERYHHSEELAYMDRIETGGVFGLSSRQSTGTKHDLHTTEIEVLLPGIADRNVWYQKILPFNARL